MTIIETILKTILPTVKYYYPNARYISSYPTNSNPILRLNDKCYIDTHNGHLCITLSNDKIPSHTIITKIDLSHPHSIEQLKQALTKTKQ